MGGMFDKYAGAMNGLDRIWGGFPLSLRLIREMHEIILKSGRGASKQPGEFRRSQNWIGGTRSENALFVPPPPDRLAECLNAFELFLHSKDPGFEPELIKKGQTRTHGMDAKIIGLYAAGLSLRDIRAHLEDIYGLRVLADLISSVMDAVLEEVSDW